MEVSGGERDKIASILEGMFDLSLVQDGIDIPGESGSDLTFRLTNLYEMDERAAGLAKRGIYVQDTRRSEGGDSHVVSCSLDLERLREAEVWDWNP